MDRVELEALADRMVDEVQMEGVAIGDTDDTAALRKAIRTAARARSMRVRTGVAQQKSDRVWAARPNEDADMILPSRDQRKIDAFNSLQGRPDL